MEMVTTAVSEMETVIMEVSDSKEVMGVSEMDSLEDLEITASPVGSVTEILNQDKTIITISNNHNLDTEMMVDLDLTITEDTDLAEVSILVEAEASDQEVLVAAADLDLAAEVAASEAADKI